MTNLQELVGVLIVVLVIWFVLKMAQVAIRIIFTIIALILIAGAVYWVFMR
jgi:hypothetical protein